MTACLAAQAAALLVALALTPPGRGPRGKATQGERAQTTAGAHGTRERAAAVVPGRLAQTVLTVSAGMAALACNPPLTARRLTTQAAAVVGRIAGDPARSLAVADSAVVVPESLVSEALQPAARRTLAAGVAVRRLVSAGVVMVAAELSLFDM